MIQQHEINILKNVIEKAEAICSIRLIDLATSAMKQISAEIDSGEMPNLAAASITIPAVANVEPAHSSDPTETTPEQPPVSNEFVAEGAEPFSEPVGAEIPDAPDAVPAAPLSEDAE